MKILSPLVLSVFFEDFNNMLSTGMSLSQILISLKETSQDKTLNSILSHIEKAISEGSSLSEAMAHMNAFPWIVITTLKAGEESGKLAQTLEILSQYFKRQNEIFSKLREAFIYPAIVFVFLVGVMLFVGLKIVPQLRQLLPDENTQHSSTQIVLALSHFLQHHLATVLLFPILAVVGLISFYYKKPILFESFIYRVPLIGQIKKETDLAYYFLNLSVLLKNGNPLLKSLNDLNVMQPSKVSQHFYNCRDYLFGGMPLWESLQINPFFSSVVVFTVRRAEEMARLPEYCFNLSGYFNKRVSQCIDQLLLFIQPALLAFGGLFLVLIAFAFLIPIYGSLTQLAGGQ